MEKQPKCLKAKAGPGVHCSRTKPQVRGGTLKTGCGACGLRAHPTGTKKAAIEE